MATALPQKKKNNRNSEDWLTTYADAITLLLCFFVIILSISEPKQSKFEELKEGMMTEFTEQVVETPFNDIFDAFNSIVQDMQMEQDMAVEETEKGIVIELSSGAFFEPGSAKLRKEVVPIIQDVALELLAFDYENHEIEIEGHTDDVPISTAIYPSNWELSAGRAASIVKLFIEQGLPTEKMKATGYADTRPKVPNLDLYGEPIPENRSLNRRVAIRIERAD